MASPDAGNYQLILASGSSSSPKAMDVYGNSVKNGTDIHCSGVGTTPAQFFTVSYRTDGSARITHRLSGKSLDVAGGYGSGTPTTGTNVWLYKAWPADDVTNGMAQSWLIESDGSTATYDGSTYPTYTIKMFHTQTLAVATSGTTSAGSPEVKVVTYSSGTATQRWIFLPVAPFGSGGTYEIHSMLSTDTCLDIYNGSTNRGANVWLYPANGTNAQKFVLTEETDDHWSIQSVKSGLYVDVAAGSTAGANVQQWDDDQSRAQRWLLTSYGTTTVDGFECEVVTLGSYVSGGGAALLMDVQNALTTGKTNIDIQSAATGTNMAKQRFALVPTSPEGTSVPAVADIGWSASVGDANRDTTMPEATTLYPSWTCTESWSADGPNHYEMRYRNQSMAGVTGEWDDWSAWTAWETVATTSDGANVWMTDGLAANVASGSRALQYEVQVRAATYDGTEVIVGAFTSATLRAVQVANITINTLAFSPEGLRIAFTSDYDGGTNVIQVTSVISSGTKILTKAVTKTGLDASDTVLIPAANLKSWIDEGATVSVRYKNGTDMLPLGGTTHSYTGTVTYEAGSSASATPTISLGEGRSVNIDFSGAGVTGAWMVADGVVTEMDVSDGSAKIYPPFGDTAEYEFFVSYESGDDWGYAHITSAQVSAAIGSMKPCHVWNWDGGCFLLELREGSAIETEYSVSRNVATHALNSREWESVYYQRTKSGSFTAEGILKSGLESTRDDLFELCDQGHAVYRSPSGLVADVAVTGFNLTEHKYWSEVSVSMTRVTN